MIIPTRYISDKKKEIMEVKSINHVTFPEAAEAIETEAGVGNIKKKVTQRGLVTRARTEEKETSGIAIRPSHHHRHLLQCLGDLLVIGI